MKKNKLLQIFLRVSKIAYEKKGVIDILACIGLAFVGD